MNTFILVIWSINAVMYSHRFHDWRPIGEFQSQTACIVAAGQLGIDKEQFRCVSTK